MANGSHESSSQTGKILNIAFYQFEKIVAPLEVRPFFKEICEKLNLKGCILLSEEGINGCISGKIFDVREFQSVLKAESAWSNLEYKESYSDQIGFRRMLVKVKKEIIPLGDTTIQPEQFTAPKISAKELKKWLDEKRSFYLLDTRNEYEINHGTFQGSLGMGTRTFRQIPEKLKNLSSEIKDQPVVMFCTGGIRCEKASVVALKEGFKEVYQLDGGILKYFEECGGSYFEGNCFVFDRRVAVDSELKPIEDHSWEEIQEAYSVG